jgi:hypothetical protein
MFGRRLRVRNVLMSSSAKLYSKAPVVKKKKDLKRGFHINHHNKQWATVAGVLLVVIIDRVVGFDLSRSKSQVFITKLLQTTVPEQVKAAEHGVSETEVSQGVVYVEHTVRVAVIRDICAFHGLSVDSRVVTLEHHEENRYGAACQHTHDVNWFEGSAKPGEQGVVLLGGIC